MMSGCLKDRYTHLDKQRELIILLYDIGFTVQEIADFFKVSSATIYKRLLEWDVSLRSGNKLKDISVDDYYGECFENMLTKLLQIRRRRLAKYRSLRKSKSKSY